jgi:hypothetical protein
LKNSPQMMIGELRASFERQLSVYRELRDAVRSNFSNLILARGDPGVLMVGVEKKVKLIDRINEERKSMAEHIEFWQAYRQNLPPNDKDAVALNDILNKTEAVIKEFLTEEEKLKQYVEKMYNKGSS